MAHHNVTELEDIVISLEADIIDKDIDIAELEIVVKEHEEEIKMLKNLNSGFVDQITKLKDKSYDLDQELQHSREKMNRLKKDNLDQALTIDKLTEELGFDIDSPYIQAERQELEDLEDKLEDARNQRRYWEKQCLRLENEKVDLHTIVNRQDDKILELDEELEVCNERNEDLRRELKSVANQRNLLLAEKNGSLDNHLDAVAEKDMYIDLLKDRCRELHLEYGKKLDKCENEKTDLLELKQARESKIVSLEERNDTLLQERAELVRSQITKLDELRNRIDELEELNHELISQNIALEDGLADMGFYRDESGDG